MTTNNIIDEIIRVEGGYVDDPSDSGGATNYGITENVARQNGYHGHMRELPRSLAERIYLDKYWHSVCGNALNVVDPRLAHEVVDTGVNMGTRRAVIILQRALNSLNLRGSLYRDLIVDGRCGNNTISALRDYNAVRDIEVLLKALNCLQGAYYIELSERREKDERFVYGWLKNRVNL